MNIINLANNFEEIKHILSENIPWSPLDFIKEISRDGDKSIFLNRLFCDLEPKNDLRFIYFKDSRKRLAIFAEKLPWDSNFFGYGVGKINGIFLLSEPYFDPYDDYTNAVIELIKLAKGKGIKYLFAVVDARDIALIRSLGSNGFCLIETRVYYHRDIRNYEYKERYPVRTANEDDIYNIIILYTETHRERTS